MKYRGLIFQPMVSVGYRQREVRKEAWPREAHSKVKVSRLCILGS